jgi:hypothetical protein
MEPEIGFEPMTDGLQNRCSTTELHRRMVGRVGFEPTGAVKLSDLQSDATLQLCRLPIFINLSKNI